MMGLQIEMLGRLDTQFSEDPEYTSPNRRWAWQEAATDKTPLPVPSPSNGGSVMRTSARNALSGTIRRIIRDGFEAEVVLEIADRIEISATITERSLRDLELDIGQTVTALLASTFIILAREDNVGRTSARNRLTGIIAQREDTPILSEILLDIGHGRILAATITRTSAESLALVPGDRACALIKSSHVILAID